LYAWGVRGATSFSGRPDIVLCIAGRRDPDSCKSVLVLLGEDMPDASATEAARRRAKAAAASRLPLRHTALSKNHLLRFELRRPAMAIRSSSTACSENGQSTKRFPLPGSRKSCCKGLNLWLRLPLVVWGFSKGGVGRKQIPRACNRAKKCRGMQDWGKSPFPKLIVLASSPHGRPALLLHPLNPDFRLFRL
jgi:hypothetical protein